MRWGRHVSEGGRDADRASAEREGGRVVWPDREGAWAWAVGSGAGWAAREESEGGEGLGWFAWVSSLFQFLCFSKSNTTPTI